MSAGKEEQACGGLYSGEAKRGNTREDLCHFALEITHVKVWELVTYQDFYISCLILDGTVSVKGNNEQALSEGCDIFVAHLCVTKRASSGGYICLWGASFWLWFVDTIL